MNCRTAERLIVRARDLDLAAADKGSLEAHLGRCERCRRVSREYQDLFRALRPDPVPAPGAFSWERMRARIEEREASAIIPFYERWALKAIPAAVALAFLIGSAALLFQPAQPAAADPTAELLIHNTNPLTDAETILEQQKAEDAGLMLIFAANGTAGGERR